MTKLPGLNGLRAIAATLVLIGHVYQIAGDFGNEQAADIFKKHEVGFDMVNLFFVISGFIITFILLQEKRTTGTISLKNFYYKRILRIWPIYFLIIAVVYLLSHYTSVYKVYEPLTLGSLLVLCLFILPVDVAFIHYPIGVIPHYWSLSVEEQFYAYWPVVVKKINVLKFSLGLIILWVILRNSFAYFSTHSSNNTFFNGLNTVFLTTQFPSMAIGAIGAYAVVNKKNWFAFLLTPFMQIIIWVFFLASIITKFYIPYINFEIKAFLYLLLILSVTTVKKPLISLENKFFDLTGKISYGIYMYHWPLIPIIILGLQKIGADKWYSQVYFIPLVVLCFGITFIISYFSFNYFELYFLNKRPKGNIYRREN